MTDGRVALVTINDNGVFIDGVRVTTNERLMVADANPYVDTLNRAVDADIKKITDACRVVIRWADDNTDDQPPELHEAIETMRAVLGA